MARDIVKTWDNSPYAQLPMAIMQGAASSVDDTVNIVVKNGRIVIVPVKVKE